MSFDTLAPHYRWMEFVLAGEKLQRCRLAFLDRAADARDVLILGEGPGRFLVECRRRLPHARITCVDSSVRMLAVARRRLATSDLDCERVTFLHADALEWKAAEMSADLLVTHFFLDCFRPDQLHSVIGKLGQIARRNAFWLLADFQTPCTLLSGFRARMILKTMYYFFRVVTRLPAKKLTSPDHSIEQQGFELCQRKESEWGLLRSDLWKR
jgi:ubiquinone/menaquinone biosynthesis C-methylase UbiE